MTRQIIAFTLCAGALTGARAASADDLALALRDIDRAMTIADASWSKTIKGREGNLYMADTYDTQTKASSGPSDIWPLTAAVEAHCSLLEALEAARPFEPELYEVNFDKYLHRLDVLIDNLEFYRGTFTLSSYASKREWSPYAVPRASSRGKADVTGILNVYDDQMWLSRELIRAYRITDNRDYLDLATYLADYVIDGWDCWRDADGNEYGGITWGPGYNSKHACSNAPIIQPLAWLSEIYSGTGETADHYWRDADNNVCHDTPLRSDLYRDFARKVYDWQHSRLLHPSGVYWDMMGADNTIRVVDGYRRHVDCGNPTGSLISYNTGTMISGAASLYSLTGDETLLADLSDAAKASFTKFTHYVRKQNTYEFNTDETAAQGFNTWFNDVLMRSYADALPYCSNSSARNGLNAFQTTLDYAYENHLRDGLMPIHLIDGWGDETLTKGFHQFAFVSQYAVLAATLLGEVAQGVENVAADNAGSGMVYTLSGIPLGDIGEVGDTLPRDIYVVGGHKRMLGHR